MFVFVKTHIFYKCIYYKLINNSITLCTSEYAFKSSGDSLQSWHNFSEFDHRPFQITILCQIFIEIGAYEISFCFFIPRHIFLQFGKQLFVTFISPTNHIRQEVEQETKIPCKDSFLQISPFRHISSCCILSSLLVGTVAFQMETGIICPYQTGLQYNHTACSNKILPVLEYD